MAASPGSGSPAASTEVVLPLEVEEFLLWLSVERGRSPATLDAYRRDLSTFIQYLTDQGGALSTVEHSDLVGYLRNRQGMGLAPSSVTRAMVAVRSLFRFMSAEGLREDDPSAQLELPSVPRGLPKALSEQAVTALIGAVDGDGALPLRDRAILEMLYGTGVRISELVGMSLGDVDLGDRLVRVFGKGSKERIVPLGSYASDALRAYLQPSGRGRLEPERWVSRDDAEAVFLNRRGGRLSRQGGWGVVKKYGAEVGLGAKLSPHTLRHCCATHMLEHGADIRTVQELLGHASITTTQVYTHVSRSQLLGAYDAAHPRALA